MLFVENMVHTHPHLGSLLIYVRKQTNWFALPCACGLFTGSDLWRGALQVALNQEINKSWYVSTLELQLASFEICTICRGARRSRVRVYETMPLSLWGNEFSVNPTEGRRVPGVRASHVEWYMPTDMLVPVLFQSTLLSGITSMDVGGHSHQGWYTATGTHGNSDISEVLKPDDEQVVSPRTYFEAMMHLDSLNDTKFVSDVTWPDRLATCWLSDFGSSGTCLRWGDLMKAREGSFKNNVCQDSWPPSLHQLKLGCNGPNTIRKVAAPSPLCKLAGRRMVDRLFGCISLPFSLKVLTFGESFNQPITDIMWPASLLELTFSGQFDQPITGIVWPAFLRRLSFSSTFNQPIANVVWPSSLLALKFGHWFDQSVTDVRWPKALQEMTIPLSGPIDSVVFPRCLLTLGLNGPFNVPIDIFPWPIVLQSLVLGPFFDQPIERVVWPEHLRALTFGFSFNQQIAAVKWPNSLAHIEFGHSFDKNISKVKWPTSLLRLEFGNAFNHTIEGTSWPESIQELVLGTCGDDYICINALPSSLRRLTFGNYFNQPISEEDHLPIKLEELQLGLLFDHPIDGVVWPASLVKLTLSEHFNQPVHNVVWPASIRQLQFGYHFNQPVGGVVWPPSLERLSFGDIFGTGMVTGLSQRDNIGNVLYI